ncbi:MAG TPA: protein kinase, partial [Polyangiaceae bacterium]|nr:protein kinase [Polyangiaceae bacterium]
MSPADDLAAAMQLPGATSDAPADTQIETVDAFSRVEPGVDPRATAVRARASGVASDVQPGTVIKHYELIRKLGAGGMGKVFLARDFRLGRLVAIKFLLEHTGTAADRFLIEARTTAQCRHENIVVIYDVGEVHGSPYMVLEYVEGRTLREAMAEPAPDRAQMAIERMLPVVRALCRAHAMGIVHRDLKPENILLSDDGQIKVLDFGIAKQIVREPGETMHAAMAPRAAIMDLTRDGALVGTMPYMSPEQWLGEALDARSDIWAAGVILFELATGTHPLEPLTLSRLKAVSDLEAPMPAAQDQFPDAHPLPDIIDRCLRKRKEERLGSAEELALALERIGSGKRASARADDEAPYAGLAAFQEADAARFFGREQDVAAVVGRLRNHELVAIAGPSGAGKSSFVRAGVIPALKRSGGHLEAFVVRPGRRPLAALADVLASFVDTETGEGSGGVAAGEADPEIIAKTLETQPGYLGAELRARCRRRGSDHRILLVVDQLEELYTLGIDPQERSAFCACIEGVADDASSPLRVVTTMRADFLDRLTEDRRLLAEVTRGLFFLPPMTREGLRDALTKPLEAAHHRFEDDALVDEMLDGLAGTKSPLPILQFTATKLWEARDREGRILTRRAYGALGGVSGALSAHADAVLLGMSLPEQRRARAVLLRLVTPERTRAVVLLDELCALTEDASVALQVVQHLADARLLSIEAGNEREGKTVELTHESLIERWAKLKQWLDENEKDAQFLVELRGAASQWDNKGGADDFLWRDQAALEAGQWLARRRAEVGEEGTLGVGKREVRYLEAVVRLAERTRRRRRQLFAALFAALTVIAVVVSMLALGARAQARRADEQAKRADEQAKQAQEEAREARNATRLATARELQEKDPTKVLALLREIEPGSVPRGWVSLALWARSAALAEVTLVHDDRVLSVAFSPDGQRIVSGSMDKTVRVWNADGTGQPIVLRGHDKGVHSVAFSPDGRRIVSASYDRTVRVWNADGAGLPLVLRGHDATVHSASFSPDARRILTASADKTVRVWNA